MILDAIISLNLNILNGILQLIPNVPAMPTAIVNGAQFAFDALANVMGLFNLIFSAPLMAALIICLVGLLLFEQAYWIILWALKKIPFINIK